jgi:predicted Zn-dependent protease
MKTEQECSRFWEMKFLSGAIKGLNDEKSKQAELEYKEKCGSYDPKILECISLNSEMQSKIINFSNESLLSSDKYKTTTKQQVEDIKKAFNDKGCIKIIEQYRQAELGKVVSKFSDLDKARITAESIYERNQRIFFGALVLIGGVVIITMFSKKK